LIHHKKKDGLLVKKLVIGQVRIREIVGLDSMPQGGENYAKLPYGYPQTINQSVNEEK
jgi:hypothetical protein